MNCDVKMKELARQRDTYKRGLEEAVEFNRRINWQYMMAQDTFWRRLSVMAEEIDRLKGHTLPKSMAKVVK